MTPQGGNDGTVKAPVLANLIILVHLSHDHLGGDHRPTRIVHIMVTAFLVYFLSERAARELQQLLSLPHYSSPASLNIQALHFSMSFNDQS
jgi:hypothetical protein